MVDIDRVYQKVLALANKEQRGHITPQEFNLLADKAQLEIINNYFHGVKTAYQKPKNQTEAFDEAEMLREKLSHIRTTTSQTISTTGDLAVVSLPTNAYMIATVFLPTSPPVEIIEVDRHRLLEILSNPLTTPTARRPIYLRKENTLGQIVNIEIFPSDITDLLDLNTVNVDYWERPNTPNWGYVVVNEKALYNFNTSVHFKLHPSEEEPLVMRILGLAGVIIKSPEIVQTSMVDKASIKQEQNS